MEKQYKVCQSCGMPMKQDPKGGSTNSDGSKNLIYCSYCYQDGKFTQPDITVDAMKKLVKDKLKEMKFPGFIASFFTMGISKLERWKK